MPWQKPSWAKYGLSIPVRWGDPRPHDMVVLYMRRHPEVRFWSLRNRQTGENKPENALLYYDVLRLAEQEAGVPRWEAYVGETILEPIYEILPEDLQYQRLRADNVDEGNRNSGTEPPTEN